MERLSPPAFPDVMHTARSTSPPAWMRGLQRYRESGYARPPQTHACIWERNHVRCLHAYPARDLPPDAPVALLVPSLINRYYILDLCDGISMAQHLARNGVRVYILDWGTPLEQEATTDAADYVTDYLLPLLDALHARHGQPVRLAGYCIGGLLALAGTLIAPQCVASLALLATPWDFHATQPHSAAGASLSSLCGAVTDAWCQHERLLPGAYLSWLFYLADPIRFQEKYGYFAELEDGSAAYEQFLAVEHWVNDSVPLTRAFAHTCLIDWAQHNHTARLQWKVGGRVIDPAALEVPALVVAPCHDRIVPQASALSLARSIPVARTLSPPSGHIGMMVGRHRRSSLWNPLLEWITSA